MTREQELRNKFEGVCYQFLRKMGGYDDEPWYITLCQVDLDTVTIKEEIFENKYQIYLWYFVENGMTKKELEKIKEIFF